MSLGRPRRSEAVPGSVEDGEELSADREGVLCGYPEPQELTRRAPRLCSILSTWLFLPPFLPVPFASPLFSFLCLHHPPLSLSLCLSHTYTESHLPQNAEIRHIWSFLCCLNGLEPRDGISELPEDSLYLCLHVHPHHCAPQAQWADRVLGLRGSLLTGGPTQL